MSGPTSTDISSLDDVNRSNPFLRLLDHPPVVDLLSQHIRVLPSDRVLDGNKVNPDDLHLDLLRIASTCRRAYDTFTPDFYRQIKIFSCYQGPAMSLLPEQSRRHIRELSVQEGIPYSSSYVNTLRFCRLRLEETAPLLQELRLPFLHHSELAGLDVGNVPLRKLSLVFTEANYRYMMCGSSTVHTLKLQLAAEEDDDSQWSISLAGYHASPNVLDLALFTDEALHSDEIYFDIPENSLFESFPLVQRIKFTWLDRKGMNPSIPEDLLDFSPALKHCPQLHRFIFLGDRIEVGRGIHSQPEVSSDAADMARQLFEDVFGGDRDVRGSTSTSNGDISENRRLRAEIIVMCLINLYGTPGQVGYVADIGSWWMTKATWASPQGREINIECGWVRHPYDETSWEELDKSLRTEWVKVDREEERPSV